MENTKTLHHWRRNVYSQNGEDGILEELLKRIGLKKGTCLEVGAWDGKKFSNTWKLLEQGWTGVFIEGDEQKFLELVHNLKPYRKHSHAFNHYIQPDGERTIDLLADPLQLDLISIDIDSCDYQVWKGLKQRPAVVVIEIDSNAPVDAWQVHGAYGAQKTSWAPMWTLGKSRGYTLVAHTGNMIFIRDDLRRTAGVTDEWILDPLLLWDPRRPLKRKDPAFSMQPEGV